ncbi:OmpA family protein [Marinobacter xestospongiae]|uniref:OmpA family protein n=1 Tax=Marinobacter xestospongiae TaxID=994319 RepID=A0ABU3VVW1_9GAMM|nr:OmpA family protein [Marinobacter xestospongiae]MDV2078137.1 OmpA family protein [Marinobacter xestospongiae]
MTLRTLITSATLGALVLLTGCAGAPKQNPVVDEAQILYDQINNDPAVARSASTQLRSARKNLEEAQALLEDDADTSSVEHRAYLALRHAEIAREQGLRSELEAEVANAEERRKQLELQRKELELAKKQSELQRSAEEAEALRRRMEAMQAEQTERGMVLTLGDVLFDVGKADLKPAAERTIDRLAEFMRAYPERRVLIEGYTDSTGDEGFNQRLSENRAGSVRDALAANGVSPGRIDTRGFGEAYPKASNDNASGRQQNRRVEIVISDEQGNIQTR